ncbi:MAG: hypothetical protein ACREMJ_00930 [Gemmatimonadales bacterium]
MRKLMGAGLAIAAAAAAAVVAAACGEGRAIFNVDVYSFMKDDVDTIPYAAVPATTPPLRVTSLGLGNSSVDTARIVAGGTFLNGATGTGDVAVRVFFSVDSATTYDPANEKFTLSAVALQLNESRDARDSIDLVADPVFQEPFFFVGLRVEATSGTATGRFALNELRVRIVLRDDVF